LGEKEYINVFPSLASCSVGPLFLNESLTTTYRYWWSLKNQANSPHEFSGSMRIQLFSESKNQMERSVYSTNAQHTYTNRHKVMHAHHYHSDTHHIFAHVCIYVCIINCHTNHSYKSKLV